MYQCLQPLTSPKLLELTHGVAGADGEAGDPRLLHHGLEGGQPVLVTQCSQRGGDSGRHSWYRWMDGPQPEGTKTTVAINIFDLVLLKVVA